MPDEPTKPVYVLWGDDAYLQDAARRQIVARAVGNADPQTCVVSLDATAELADVLDELRTLPFLAPVRVVIVRDADAFVSAHRGALEAYLERPTATAVLVLMVSSWPKNTRLAKIVPKIGEAIPCGRVKGEALRTWLTGAAARRGKKLAPRAAELLAACAEGDLGLLEGEIEKLSIYVGSRETITPEDLTAVSAATAGAVDFALSNALAALDAPGALTALHKLMAGRGAEFMVLGQIAFHLRRALGAQQLASRGLSPEGALRMPYRAKQSVLSLLRRRNLRAMQADFRRLTETDLAMKSGADPAAAMQRLVVELCS